MQNMKQTQVNDHNRLDFYRHVYPMQQDQAQSLINITNESSVIAVDCCGWHYASVFDKPIIMLETLSSAKNYQLLPTQWTKLIDDRGENLIWPKLSGMTDPVMILDRSPILKYRTISAIMALLHDMCQCYRPVKIVIRGSLMFVDDSRLIDRFQSWTELVTLPHYIVMRFCYDTDLMSYEISLKRRT